VALPILEQVLAGEQGDPHTATAPVLQRASADPTVHQQLAALLEDDYLTGATPHWPLGAGRPRIVADVLRLTPKGRRAVGQWPGEQSGEILIRVLEETVMDMPEGEDKGRLNSLLTAARGVGVDLLSSIAAKLIKSASGLP
jgi:hypothetical protein